MSLCPSSQWGHILIGLLRMGDWISLGVQVVILKFQNSMNEDPKHQEGDSMRQETLWLFCIFYWRRCSRVARHILPCRAGPQRTWARLCFL